MRFHGVAGLGTLGDIERTIDALSEMKARVVVPTHCTGFNSTIQFAKRMPEVFVLNSVGTTIRIFT